MKRCTHFGAQNPDDRIFCVTCGESIATGASPSPLSSAGPLSIPTSDKPQWHEAPRNGAVITDIDIPFWRIVLLMVKWAIATIPALILLYLIGVLFFGVIGSIGLVLHR